MFAARNGHVNVIEFLLSVGADPKAVTHSARNTLGDLLNARRDTTAGRTALDIAKSFGQPEVVAVLETHMGQAREMAPNRALQRTC